MDSTHGFVGLVQFPHDAAIIAGLSRLMFRVPPVSATTAVGDSVRRVFSVETVFALGHADVSVDLVTEEGLRCTVGRGQVA